MKKLRHRMKCLNDLPEELGTLPGLGPAVPDSIPAVSLEDIPISHPAAQHSGVPQALSPQLQTALGTRVRCHKVRGVLSLHHSPQ